MVVKFHRPAMTCGYRTVGYYVCERPVEGGSPIEVFIPCPVPMVDMEAIGLSKTGMRIIQRYDAMGIGLGIYDLWDFVSQTDNPCVTDFVEQTRNLGTSRRLPETMVKDPLFKKLKPHPFDPSLSSRHIYVHACALVEDPGQLYSYRSNIKHCPAGIEAHDNNEATWETCAALWWEMVDDWPRNAARRHQVLLPRDREEYPEPSCQYWGDYLPQGFKPVFMAGIIMSIPLMQMEVPQDDSGDNKHERLMKLLEQGGWQYRSEVTED